MRLNGCTLSFLSGPARKMQQGHHLVHLNPILRVTSTNTTAAEGRVGRPTSIYLTKGRC